MIQQRGMDKLCTTAWPLVASWRSRSPSINRVPWAMLRVFRLASRVGPPGDEPQLQPNHLSRFGCGCGWSPGGQTLLASLKTLTRAQGPPLIERSHQVLWDDPCFARHAVQDAVQHKTCLDIRACGVLMLSWVLLVLNLELLGCHMHKQPMY